MDSMTEREIAVAVDEELSHGDKRSLVYRQGMVDVLRLKFHGTPLPTPYRPGSVEFDAYYSGNERGHQLYRLLQQASGCDKRS